MARTKLVTSSVDKGKQAFVLPLEKLVERRMGTALFPNEFVLVVAESILTFLEPLKIKMVGNVRAETYLPQSISVYSLVISLFKAY